MLDLAPPPATVAPAAPVPAQIPPDLKAMLDAALAEGDAAVIGKMFDFARRARPDAAEAIGAMQAAWKTGLDSAKAARVAAEKAELAKAGVFDNWTGQVEFGASWSTGPASSLGLLGTLDLQKQGLDWTHRVSLRGEVLDTDNVRAVERFVASWQPRRTLGPRAYLFGLGQFERDPALGYDARYSAGAGAGWTVEQGKGFRLTVEGGPAYRLTEANGAARSRIAGRGSVDLGWALTPRLDFSQKASLFYEAGTSSGFLSSALDSKVTEKLNLRVSYEYRIEEDTMRGLSSTGSTTRASLVYRLR
jgi:putative salt-induced outer membrane protein